MKGLNQFFDIVYVDNNDGFDDILRNARLFEEAMIRINEKKDNLHDKNYVIGLGMGGLVARYVLRDMEKKGLNHDVCKFISLNTPHKGANIPLGLQALVKYMQNIKLGKNKVKDILESIENFSELLEKKAMKQMMVYSIDNKYAYSEEHIRFMEKYESMGMPVQCENVAISNGKKWASPIAGAGKLLFKSSNEIDNFEGEINYLKQKQELRYFSVAKIIMGMKCGKKKLYSSSDMVALDDASGSTLSLNKVLSNLGRNVKKAFKVSTFCFVPTVSALAINNWEDKLVGIDEIDPSASSFDRVYALNYNYEYADLKACKDLLLKEIAPQIIGKPDYITGETTFTLTNVPSFLPITWSLSNDNFKIVSRSGMKVTVVPLKFNSSSELIVSIPLPNSPSISLPITSDELIIWGDTYISQLKNRYELYSLPENTTLRWRVADGLKIEQQSGLSIIAYAEKKTTPWIEAIITTRYNTETIVRKELKCVPLTGASLKRLDTWFGKDSNGKSCRKYAYQLVYEPAEIPVNQLEFCWSSSVGVVGKNPGSIPTSPSKRATILTEGNVASSVLSSCIDLSDLPTAPHITPFSSNEFITSDYPGMDQEKQVPYLWAHSTDHAIVCMPQITIGEESKGRLYCTVKDYLGNSFNVSSPEELYDKLQPVYHVAPNPASTTLTLSKQNQENSMSTDRSASVEPLTINLYNDFSLARSIESDTSQPEIQMNIADLPRGTYYLNVIQNGEITYKSVIMIQPE